MDAIRECGWACSTLYASDRGDGKRPVLVDGSHRLEALRRLLKSNDTSWLLRKETSQDFKVTLTVLKGLTFEEEGRIGREANHINSRHVSMTLVDHVIATHRAVIATRARLNLRRNEDLTSQTLREVHPDFKRYANSTIRAWKGLAEGLSPQARKLLLRAHASGLSSGDIRLAFSKKTLMESKMMHHLRNYPGAQFWYLKRLVNLEVDDKIRDHKAPYFEGLVLVLKSISDACTQFVGRLKHTFKLTEVAKYLDEVVQTGSPSEKLDPALKKHLTTFARDYLWTSKRDVEVQGLLQLRKKDYKMFPFVFYQLVAQLHFNENYEELDKMLETPEANLRVRFTSPVDPTQANQDYLQLLRKRRFKVISSSSLAKPAMEEPGPARKRQKNRSDAGQAEREGVGEDESEDENMEEGDSEGEEEDDSEEEDEGEDEEKEEKEDEEGQQSEEDRDDEKDRENEQNVAKNKAKSPQGHNPATEIPNDKTKPSPAAPQQIDPVVLFKTSVSLEIYQAQSSTLASTLLQNMNKLLEKTKISTGERMTLKVRQEGKLVKEKCFN